MAPTTHTVNPEPPAYLGVAAPQRQRHRQALGGAVVVGAEVGRGARQPAASLDRRGHKVARGGQPAARGADRLIRTHVVHQDVVHVLLKFDDF
jgi:hypothetical protein